MGWYMAEESRSEQGDVRVRCGAIAEYLGALVTDFDHRTVAEIRDALMLARDTLNFVNEALGEAYRIAEDEVTDPGTDQG